MKKILKWLFLGIAIYALIKRKEVMKSLSVWSVLSSFIPRVEGFSAKPYWDVNRWSWGYGTRVPNSIDNISEVPNKVITKAQAILDMVAHLHTDFSALDKLVKVQLNGNQWAAYLSFSYNLGIGNAKKLLDNINSENFEALGKQWKLYCKSGSPLKVNPTLVKRRNDEWNLFTS